MLVGSLINDSHNDWDCDWHGSGGSSVKYNNNVYVTNNNVYPTRPPGAAGYPRPGYLPPNGGYPRPGNPRPVPYAGTRPPYDGSGTYNRPNNGGIPATRPYNKATARPYVASNSNIAQPNFPKMSTLPNNKAGSNQNRNNLSNNRPNQPANPVAANRLAAAKPANRAADPARGFAKDRSTTGARNGAFGGYEPGGAAQTASGRGQASLRGNQGGFGGRGNGGGGNARRGSGGGGGGGGNRGGGRKGR